LTRPVLSVQRRLGAGRELRRGTRAAYHAVGELAGEPHLVRTDLVGGAAPSPRLGGPALACFAHLTDIHLTDVQSPARFEFINRHHADPRFRMLLPMQRPQEALNAHAVAAMLRAFDDLEGGPVSGSPVELLVNSGDAVDNVQANELAAFVALFQGGMVRLDSGGAGYQGVQSPDWPDDIAWKPDGGPVADPFRGALGFPLHPGLLERALAPFPVPGLRLPWLGCHGNHEEVIQGVGVVTPALAAWMVGASHPLALPGEIDPDDAAELFVTRPEAFTRGPAVPVSPDPLRHAFSAEEFLRANRLEGADYVHDTDTVRFIVLDTACPAGAADGCVDEDQLGWLQARLADAGERRAVLVTHHGLDSLTNRRPHAAGAVPAVDSARLLATLNGSPNLVLWLNGHIHLNQVQPRGTFWEVTTGSLVDWPCQARVVELVEAGGGRLAIACTMVDHDATLDPGEAIESQQLAALHRELAGNVPGQGFGSRRAGSELDRNVILLR
jgi:3',5'-cyclic AMP phosphodiesterase CpdA